MNLIRVKPAPIHYAPPGACPWIRAKHKTFVAVCNLTFPARPNVVTVSFHFRTHFFHEPAQPQNLHR